MYCFASPESTDGIFVNMQNWHGVGARFLELDHLRTGACLYYNEEHQRIPLPEETVEAQEAAPTKMAIGGDQGFQVNKKRYEITKISRLVVMPDKAVVQLPCPELPELLLQAITGIQVLPALYISALTIPCCTAAHVTMRLTFRETKVRTNRSRHRHGRKKNGRASMLGSWSSCHPSERSLRTRQTGNASLLVSKKTSGSIFLQARLALVGATGTGLVATVRYALAMCISRDSQRPAV